MRRVVVVPVLSLLTIVPQACQRDEATAPPLRLLSAKAMGVSTSRIAFTSNGQIYVMNADGSAPTRLTVTGKSNTQPSWSPDGRQIAFTGRRSVPSGVDDFIDIFVMNGDGSGQTQLTHNGFSDVGNGDPTWSPDGQRIAFTYTRQEIHVVNADGSGEMGLTPAAESQHDPSWSPDGRQIAFEGNASQIYVMNADGSGSTQLTAISGGNGEPTWSPDGRQIAFTSGRDGNDEIYVMNADGSSQTRLTNNPASDGSPTWSPDGSQIAFATNRDGTGGIYVMNADGSGQTSLGVSGGDPSWSPAYHGKAPAYVTFTTQPPSWVWANAVIAPSVEVTVTDESGAPVKQGLAKVTIGASPASGATLSGTTKVSIQNGVATFSDLRIDLAGRGYTLLVEAGPASGTSGAFAIVEPETHLAFVTQPPATVEPGAAITPPVRVAIQDALGNTISSASAPVTLTLGANPSGTRLFGTTTVDAVDGIATFTRVFVFFDGSGYTLVATSPGRAGATSDPFAVQTSPQPSTIAFRSDRDGNPGDIYVMNADGSAPVRLTNSTRFEGEASWSPDGRQIAFTKETRVGVDQVFDIWVMNADGSGQTQLTSTTYRQDHDPSWSPDGRQIAYTRRFLGDIYVMNADGSAQTDVTNHPALDEHPSWSPDGREIAFATYRDDNAEIYVMNADGSAPTRLTNNPAEDDQPRWSPTGPRIAFTSYRDGNAEIYVMNADGSSQTRLTNNPASDYSPTWSPDGSQIAFASNRDGNFEIYVMNADGSSQTRVTNNPADDFEPAWSPQVASRAPAWVSSASRP